MGNFLISVTKLFKYVVLTLKLNRVIKYYRFHNCIWTICKINCIVIKNKELHMHNCIFNV